MVDLQLPVMRMEPSTSLIMTPGGCSTHSQVSPASMIGGKVSDAFQGLVKPVRAVVFSPGGKLLAAAGDAKVIALYDVSSGEQVANLTGHAAWVFSLDWSHTGEYLLSG